MVYELIVVHPKGKNRTIFTRELELSILNDLVEGYAELIRIRYEGYTRMAYVNEDGESMGLAENEQMTRFLRDYIRRNGGAHDYPIMRGVGVVVVPKGH